MRFQDLAVNDGFARILRNFKSRGLKAMHSNSVGLKIFLHIIFTRILICLVLHLFTGLSTTIPWWTNNAVAQRPRPCFHHDYITHLLSITPRKLRSEIV